MIPTLLRRRCQWPRVSQIQSLLTDVQACLLSGEAGQEGQEGQEGQGQEQQLMEEVEGRQMLGVEVQALVGLKKVKEVGKASIHTHQCLCHSLRARGPKQTWPQSTRIKMGK